MMDNITMDDIMMYNDSHIVYNVYMVDVLARPGYQATYLCSFINEDAVKQYVAAMNEFPCMEFYKAEKLSDCYRNNIAIKYCKDEHLFTNYKRSLYDVCVINIPLCVINKDLIISRINGIKTYRKMVQAIENIALIFSIKSYATEKDISSKGSALLNSHVEYFSDIKNLINENMELKVLSNVDLAPHREEKVEQKPKPLSGIIKF